MLNTMVDPMQIIVNADDFGISEDVNASILDLHNKGIVKSASLISKGECVEHAMQIAKQHSELGIGVHLALDGPFNIGLNHHTILDKNNNCFLPKEEIIRRIKRLKTDEGEIYNEYCLQIDRVMDNNIRVSHLDHHHHLHLYFPVLRIMIKAARKYNIPFIRSQRILLHNSKNIFKNWYRSIHQFYLRLNHPTTDGIYEVGINEEYDKDPYERFNNLVELKHLIPEVILHPSGDHKDEINFITSDRIERLMEKIRIINYHDLA